MANNGGRPEGMSRTVQGVIISLITAVIVSYFIPPRMGDLYLDLHVASRAQTTIQVFFDTGNGFNQTQSSSRGLPGREEPWLLRFKLPDQAVERIRIDFGAKAEQIVVRKAALFCLNTDVKFLLALEQIEPLKDVASITSETGTIQVRAGGADPQLGLSLAGLYAQKFSLRLVLLLFLLFYPLSWAVVRLTCGRCRRDNSSQRYANSCPGIRREGLLHKVLLGGAVTVITLACVHLWEMNNRKSVHFVAGLDHSVKPYTTPFNFSEERIVRPDGLEISTHLYKPDSELVTHPALLLLHGNYPAGQSYPLYKVLARELADSGFVVMTIDLAGYGESEDPFARGPETDLSFESETRAALEHLRRLSFVDSESIGLIGHSMGADPALRVGLRDKEVASIVLIGPPRRVQERFHSPADTGFFWYWANKVRKERYGIDGFPSWYSRDRWRDDILERDMLHLLPSLIKGQHSPLLFIDGELEPLPDRRFLDDYVGRCSLPRGYLTLGKADHDCNVRIQDGSIYYDPAVMGELVGAIGRWHAQDRTKLSKWKDYFFNTLNLLFQPPSFRTC